MTAKSVLFATDFSPVSDRLLRYAATIARIQGAQFLVAHVAAPDVYNIGCAGAVRSAVRDGLGLILGHST